MTRRFAVVGDPVGHSASPRMHDAAYAALGLDCSYEAIRATADELPGLVARLRDGELDGLNVTIPHKHRVLAHVDGLDPTARTSSGANTLVRERDGFVVAHNTDTAALASELECLGVGGPEARALVLGAGGAAKSAVVALACHLRVGEITVRGRVFADAAARDAWGGGISALLRAAGAVSSLHLEPWGPRDAIEREVSAIVQATSAGMAGGAPGGVAADGVAWRSVRHSAVALDVVYGEGATPFLTAAQARGLRVTDGSGMLARQGALAFELWLRRPAPFDVMLSAL